MTVVVSAPAWLLAATLALVFACGLMARDFFRREG